MHKNKYMRIAGLLMALTLITSCLVGGTFAKYTTSGAGSDNARVAKWGVTVSASSDMFSASYAKSEQNTVVLTGSNTGLVAKASDSKDIIAPGIENTLANITLGGSPEVAVKVSYTLTTLELAGWTIDTNVEYCPLVFTVGSTEYKIDGESITDVEGLITAVKNAVAAETATYGPGTNLATVKSTPLTFKVRWDLSHGSDTYRTDAKDTKLGNLATAPTINVSLSATVEQIGN